MRKLLILVALVAALGLGVYFVIQRQESAERQARRDARLLDFDELSVGTVIVTKDGVDWRMTREPSGWRIVEPVRDAGNAETIESLMSATEQVPVLQVIDDPEALSAYGLDPAVTTVRFEGVDAVLHLGKPAPTGAGLFARVEGRPGVLLLELTAVTAPDLDDPHPFRYRDASFLGVTRGAIRAMVLTTPRGVVRLEHDDDGWWLSGPPRVPASDEAVDRLLDGLDTAEIREFYDGVDPASEDYGLTTPALKVDVETDRDSRELVIGPGPPEGRRFSTRSDRDCVVAVFVPGFEDLPVNGNALAADQLLRVNRYRIEEFTYERGGQRLTAVRRGEDWSTGDGESLPSGEVFELLRSVIETPVRSWREGAAGSAHPVAALSYRTDGGDEGTVEFLEGGVARVSTVPGVMFAIDGSAPAVPQF